MSSDLIRQLKRAEYYVRSVLLSQQVMPSRQTERELLDRFVSVLNEVHSFIPIPVSRIDARVVPLDQAVRHLFIGLYREAGDELASLNDPDVILDEDVGAEAQEPYRRRALQRELRRNLRVLRSRPIAYYSATNNVLVVPQALSEVQESLKNRGVEAEVVLTWLNAWASVEALIHQPESMAHHVADLQSSHRWPRQARIDTHQALLNFADREAYQELVRGMSAHIADHLGWSQHAVASLTSVVEPEVRQSRGYERIGELIAVEPAGEPGERLASVTRHVTRYLEEPQHIRMLMAGADPLRESGHGPS